MWSLLLLLSATLANAAEISRRDDEPNLQTNVIDLDADESDPLANANKGLGLFEGDEILDKDQEEFEEGLADTDRTWIQDARYRWPRGVLAYRFKDYFSAAEKQKIRDALAELNTQSAGCVSFVERTTEANYVEITSGPGCYSLVYIYYLFICLFLFFTNLRISV